MDFIVDYKYLFAINKDNGMNKKEAKALDKYYTNDSVAEFCYQKFVKFCTKYKSEPYTIIEPSAGGGAFLNIIQEDKIGFDILPESDNIIQMDFINGNIEEYLPQNDVVFLGNPPFGKKGDLAIQFINKCFEYSTVVGFILPVQFRKYSAQKQLDSRARLLYDIDLDEDSFNIVGESYGIRSSFQIWGIGEFEEENLRIVEKPQTKLDMFEMYQYNRTEAAMKYFDYDWDFAVHRQGYYDFSEIIRSKDELNPKRQYIFFKAHDAEVLENLLNLDFVQLSKKNAGIPGFGKADVVEEYLRKYS